MNQRNLLGKGAYGVVLASTTSDGEPVAHKYVESHSDLMREVKFMEMTQSVVGTMPLIAFNKTTRCIRMPLMPCSLKDFISRHQAGFKCSQRIWLARWVADSLLETLAGVHALGVVHLDIKPDNLMIDEDDHLVLSDFGVAARTGTVVQGPRGSPRFMSPEVKRDRIAVHPSADMYSVGRTLAEIVLPEDIRLHRGLSDFIAALCQTQPSCRPSAAAALEHPFLDKDKQRVFPISHR